MAAPMHNMFSVAVERILNGWTVLKLAVGHGMGGHDSEAKAVWMVSAIDQWFSENSDLEVYEVEDFLADVLDHEFDTVADDGSLKEIASMLCGFYKLCQTGDEAEVREKLDELPAAKTQNCVQSAVTSQEVHEDEIEDDSGGGDDKAGRSLATQNTQENTDTQTDSKDAMETDEDGWHVVKRGKRK